MNEIQGINHVQAYLEGMLWAAFGVKIIKCDAVEWQIDAVKECAKDLKEKEIEHSPLSPTEPTSTGNGHCSVTTYTTRIKI